MNLISISIIDILLGYNQKLWIPNVWSWSFWFYKQYLQPGGGGGDDLGEQLQHAHTGKQLWAVLRHTVNTTHESTASLYRPYKDTTCKIKPIKIAQHSSPSHCSPSSFAQMSAPTTYKRETPEHQHFLGFFPFNCEFLLGSHILYMYATNKLFESWRREGMICSTEP